MTNNNNEQKDPSFTTPPSGFNEHERLNPAKGFLELERRTEHFTDFGPWKIDFKRRVITIKKPFPYEIDLDRCQTPESRMKTLEHMAKKLWMTPELIGHLTQALVEAFRPLKG